MRLFSLLSDISEGGMYPDAWISSGNVGPDWHNSWYICIRIPLFKTITRPDYSRDMDKAGKAILMLQMSQYHLPSMEFPVQRYSAFVYPR